MSYMGTLAIKVLNKKREHDISNLIDKLNLRGLRFVKIQQLKKGDYCLSPRMDVDDMTPQQLQDWCNSQECYDYLNR